MDFGTKPSPGGQVAIVSAALHPAAEPAGCDQDGAPSSMDLTDDGENGRLAPFTYPRRASSADTYPATSAGAPSVTDDASVLPLGPNPD